MVTAMMPAHNAARTIAASIESILQQTYEHWELIVVDDGSTDDTAEIARRAASKDQRIKVVSIPHSGRGEARNVCLSLASGSYIAMCDADDISLKNRFERQASLLKCNPRVGVVACSRVLCFFGEPCNYFWVNGAARSEASIRFQLRRGRMRILNATAMVRRSLFLNYGGFDPELRRAQDFGFYRRLDDGVRFELIDECLVMYRTHGYTEPFRKICENDLFVRYATKRDQGFKGTFAQYAKRPSTQAFRICVVPLKYLKYVLHRQVQRFIHPAPIGISLTLDPEGLHLR